MDNRAELHDHRNVLETIKNCYKLNAGERLHKCFCIQCNCQRFQAEDIDWLTNSLLNDL